MGKIWREITQRSCIPQNRNYFYYKCRHSNFSPEYNIFLLQILAVVAHLLMSAVTTNVASGFVRTAVGVLRCIMIGNGKHARWRKGCCQ